VYDEFARAFTPAECDCFFIDKGNGKYQLDLWRANEQILVSAGVLPEHIDVTDICTCCNPDLLFSHRASHGLRGNLAGFMML
jgi:copper oxidase (laccase) domain-containing protein